MSKGINHFLSEKGRATWLFDTYRLCSNCLCKIPIKFNSPLPWMLANRERHCMYCGSWSTPPIPPSELGMDP